MGRGWPIVAPLLLLAALGCGDHEPRRPGRFPAATPVVIISVDTLRSDHLPAYGYRGVDTPAIDALRADGVLWERAYTPAPLTLPAHASLLTGVLPPTHGARDNLGYAIDADAAPMLQQALAATGYATAAAVSAFVLRADSGIARGFDLFDDDVARSGGAGLQAAQRPGSATLAAITPWLEGAADGPFFMLLHLFEPHTPYDPPEPFRSRYPSPYDGEIAAADAVVGELVALLKGLAVYDRALIVFLSDHGEGLGEHGEAEHGLFLYRSTLQVPLILKLPGAALAGSSVGEPVSLVDVAPTILEGLGLPLPAAMSGRSLLGPPPTDDAGARPLFAETLYPRLHFGWSDLAAVIQGPHQYIQAPRPELYDLTADPVQLDELAAAVPTTAAELQRTLAGWQRRLSAPAAVDADSRRRLQALGYLTGGGGELDDGPLADPKDRVHVLAALREAHAQLAAGEFAAAAEGFADVTESDPGIEDAWAMLARAQRGMGQLDAAAATATHALRLIPESASLRLQAATLLYLSGQPADAVPLAEASVAYDPLAAHSLLARIAVQRGDLARAEAQARQAVQAVPHNPASWLTLAEVLAAAGRSDQAAAELARVAGDSSRGPTLRLAVAEQLERLGHGTGAGEAIADLEASSDPATLSAVARLAARRQQWEQARRLLLRVLELDPRAARASVDLGLLALRQQQLDDARRYLESGLADDPSLADGWNALGVIRAEQGELAGAVEAWQQALAAEPRMTTVHYNLAMATARLGRYGEAAEHMQRFAATVDGNDRQRAEEILEQLRRQAASS